MSIRAFLALFVLTFATSLMAESVANDRLVITSDKDSYALTVPVSEISLNIPKGNFSADSTNIGGGTASPRYFSFVDKQENLRISGWFEPSSEYKSLDKVLQEVKDTIGKQKLLTIENISIQNINEWESFSYDIKLREFTSYNIKAELNQAGTWLDIHISIAKNNLTDIERAKATELLKSMTVVAKQNN